MFFSNLLRAISQARVTSKSPLVNWHKVSTINNKTTNFQIISDFIVPNLGLFVQLNATLHSSPGEQTYLVSFELISRIENQFFQGQCTDIVEYSIFFWPFLHTNKFWNFKNYKSFNFDGTSLEKSAYLVLLYKII